MCISVPSTRLTHKFSVHRKANIYQNVLKKKQNLPR